MQGRLRTSILAILVVIVATISASAQLPPRDARPLSRGTAVIRGRILAADSSQPLRSARVMLAAEGSRDTTVAFTNDNGEYEFAEVAAGRYTLSASKERFITLSYGQTRPFQVGRPLTVDDKQVMNGVNLFLPLGGVISGAVVDRFGDPVVDAVVMPIQRSFNEGRPTVVALTGFAANTNDVGEYRLYGLQPGSYLVSARKRSALSVAMVASPEFAYAPLYAPGTASESEAQVVKVEGGRVVTAVNVTLAAAPVASIVVSAFDSSRLLKIAIST